MENATINAKLPLHATPLELENVKLETVLIHMPMILLLTLVFHVQLQQTQDAILAQLLQELLLALIVLMDMLITVINVFRAQSLTQ